MRRLKHLAAQVDSQHHPSLISQSVNVVKSQPIFTSSRTKPFFVVLPLTVKINRAVQPPLENGPAPTVCDLLRQHEKKIIQLIWNQKDYALINGDDLMDKSAF